MTAIRRSFCLLRRDAAWSDSCAMHPMMDIGQPFNVKHVAHVTFDRYRGFLGLPEEFLKHVDGVPPSASLSVFGVRPESMQCSLDRHGNAVPTILIKLQERLYELHGLSAEGIFRISGKMEHDERVREQMSAGTVPADMDVHSIAALIKVHTRLLPLARFFARLAPRLSPRLSQHLSSKLCVCAVAAPICFRVCGSDVKLSRFPPLHPFSLLSLSLPDPRFAPLFQTWFQELPYGLLDSVSPSRLANTPNTTEASVALAAKLPATERGLLDWALNLMADVCAHGEKNRMSARNMAVVFAPNMTQVSDPATALQHVVRVMDWIRLLVDHRVAERSEKGEEGAEKGGGGTEGEESEKQQEEEKEIEKEEENKVEKADEEKEEASVPVEATCMTANSRTAESRAVAAAAGEVAQEVVMRVQMERVGGVAVAGAAEASLQPAHAAPCGDGARAALSNPRASSPSPAYPLPSARSPSSRCLPPIFPPYQAPLRIDAWSLVLSLLPPRDIASAALTCSSLAAAAAAVTAARAADSTGGSEPRAVPFLIPDRAPQSEAGGARAAGTAEGTGGATMPSAPRYAYFRYSRANVRVTSDESSFPSLLFHFQNRQIVNPPGTPQGEGGGAGPIRVRESRASAEAPPISPPIAPPYPYPQPSWWWGVLPDYLKRADRADDSKRAERQQLTRPDSRQSDGRVGAEKQQQQQQQRKPLPGAKVAQVVRGGQSDARKRKQGREGKGEADVESEWQAEQQAVARQALQAHALQDAVSSLLPAISAHARSGGGRRGWPGCDCCTRGYREGEADESVEEGEAGEGEETGARGSGSGDCGCGGGSHNCCIRAHCPCAAPLRSKAGRGEHGRLGTGREGEGRGKGRRGGGEGGEGGEGEADEAEEADEDDVVFECGPFCSCALQHCMASHPSPHTPTNTVETAAAAAAEEEGATLTPACPRCPNRSSQRGVQWSLAVVWSGSKGWTLVAQERIPRGAFICQYAVPLSTPIPPFPHLFPHLTPHLSQYVSPHLFPHLFSPLHSPSHFFLRGGAGEVHLPSGAVLRTQIDPSRMGSLGRFMSHECGGGNVARVVVRQAGCLLPAVGLVARREVRQGEELTFSYGDVGEGEGEGVDGDGDGEGKREVEGGEGGSVGGGDGEGGRVEGEGGGMEECWRGWEQQQQQQQQRRLVKRSKCCCGSVHCSGYLPFDML
ncbi:unnamed protein product [Closterium sp. Naga37s-1]|nr:unnamed protein product [Closterium sp. Naga37s-1]